MGSGLAPYFVPSLSRDGRHPGVPVALAHRLALGTFPAVVLTTSIQAVL